MLAVIQRVTSARVIVDQKTVGQCQKGFAILLGVAKGDEKSDADALANKISKLRVFEDENGKMNKAIDDVGGSCVAVSQFTLMADYSHGNRPSFFDAAPPDIAEPLYLYFCEKLRSLIQGDVQTGIFGADMHYEIHNDGPVTIIMDSQKLKK